MLQSVFQSNQRVNSKKLFIKEVQLINEDGMKVLEKTPFCAHNTIIGLDGSLVYAKSIGKGVR